MVSFINREKQVSALLIMVEDTSVMKENIDDIISYQSRSTIFPFNISTCIPDARASFQNE